MESEELEKKDNFKSIIMGLGVGFLLATFILVPILSLFGIPPILTYIVTMILMIGTAREIIVTSRAESNQAYRGK